MKKLTIIFASLALMASTLYRLPATTASSPSPNSRPFSQQFIKTHFAGVEVSYVKVDEEMFDKDCKVVFVNGSKVEFAKNGQWTDVDCKYGEVPAAIVPAADPRPCGYDFAGRKIV